MHGTGAHGADIVVVGAGFTGATAARLLAEAGFRVLVVDRRGDVGGNAHDGRDGNGLLVHTFGPHIFHTNSERIVAFLSRFTAWRPYEHRVQAVVEGRLVPLPFGLKAIRALMPGRAAAIEARLIERYGRGARVPILTLRTDGDGLLGDLADFVYEAVFRGYTLKHWGLAPEDLDPAVTARVPVIVDEDERYFQDRFQAMPRDGYTAMFRRMLGHPAITLSLSTDHADLSAAERALPTIHTGAADEHFGGIHGALPYRTVAFASETLAGAALRQPCGTVNYPSTETFTRATEQRWLTGEAADATVIVREWPGPHVPGRTEPFYPVPAPASETIAAAYRREAERFSGRIWFAGRLGDYRYYNMDQACGRAMALFAKEVLPALAGR